MDSSLTDNNDSPTDGGGAISKSMFLSTHQHLSKSQLLEMAYHESLRNTESIIKDEGTRRLRLRILMLENENDDLHEQLALADDRHDILERDHDDIRGQLEQSQEEAFRFQNDLRLQTRELQNLKAEVESMNGVTKDSAKIITEKLAIARELATLKPELEHLREQVQYQQTVLSEKLALQRQVSTLEVELEAEKRASKRAFAKNNNHEKELELQRHVDDLQQELVQVKHDSDQALKSVQKELAAEKRLSKRATQKDAKEIQLYQQIDELQRDISRTKEEGERAMKEVERQASKTALSIGSDSLSKELLLQKQLEELREDLRRERTEHDKALKQAELELKGSESRQSLLEEKLEQVRAKLRTTKEQLKKSQTESNPAQMAASSTGSSMGPPTKNPRKRGAREMSTDGNIGTPDGVASRAKRPMKRGRLEQTLVGEKSMFSITPFLNRTANMTTDTMVADHEQEEDSNVEAGQENPSDTESQHLLPRELFPQSDDIPSQPATLVPISRAKPKKNNVLKEAKPGVKNKALPVKRGKKTNTLAKVTEEEPDENEQPEDEPALLGSAEVDVATAPQLAATQIKGESKPLGGQAKKKRKLLGAGKTLFDEDDGETTKRPTKVALGPSRLLGKGGLAGPKGGLKGGLGSSSALGEFSPLKKDRRGVGASFLA